MSMVDVIVVNDIVIHNKYKVYKGFSLGLNGIAWGESDMTARSV